MKFVAIFVVFISTGYLHAQEAGNTLTHIRETGEISIGYRLSRQPVSFADNAGLPAGYSVEICKLIAEDVREAVGRDDIKVKYVTVTAQDRFEAIENGTIDILCGATTKL